MRTFDLAEDLASHGYIVVGLYAPYRSGMVVFPDGRAIPALPRNKLADHGPPQIELAEKLIQAGSADMSLALDRLTELNRADPSGRLAGMVGVRLGALPEKRLLVWTSLALLSVLSALGRAVLSAPFRFQQFAFDQPTVAILTFPFIPLPAFVVPAVVFTHLAIFRKLLVSRPGPGISPTHS